MGFNRFRVTAKRGYRRMSPDHPRVPLRGADSRLSKRALKFCDFGKMAATFCDLQSERTVRVLCRGCAGESYYTRR